MENRFNAFTDNERDVLRMALRNFSDSMFEARSRFGYETAEHYNAACSLIYELLNL